eukprot:TRINITY_DN3098_c0_g1_i1.p1 TRINITY_DN3098_c0_g1~~TRINITY_DN3098_c0_g1_i1.p1  ORF type:complete len:657 (-),score=108.32 TRINITY_DN3098_c0_g1_i1:121-2091(-)
MMRTMWGGALLLLLLLLTASPTTSNPPPTSSTDVTIGDLSASLRVLEHKLHFGDDVGKTLNYLLELSVQEPSNSTSEANMMLGDVYSSIIPVHRIMNLTRAFEYYLAALSHPFLELGRAHYMVSFLTQYHSEAVNPSYRFRNFDGGEFDWSKSHEKAVRPNMALAGLHGEMGSRAGDKSAILSGAIKRVDSRHISYDCVEGIRRMDALAASLVEPYFFNPRPSVKLKTDRVWLRKEFKNGRSYYDEEEDTMKYYQYAIDRGGSASPMVAVGIMYLEGQGGLQKDEGAAHQLFRMAADFRGDPFSKYAFGPSADRRGIAHLAYTYLHGLGVQSDNQTAVHMFQEAAERGSSAARTHLGLCHLQGECGLYQNEKEAKRYFLEAAEMGNPESKYYLAEMLSSDAANLEDVRRSVILYKEAAEGASLPALLYLARYNGNSIGSNAACQKAALMYGHIFDISSTRYLVNDAYSHFSQANYAAALIRYELAGDLGSTEAQDNAALLYEKSYVSGLELGYNLTEHTSTHKSMNWYRLASSSGNSESMVQLGDHAYYQLDRPKLAAHFYREAVLLSNAQASFNIGYMHQFGIGLHEDLHLAKRYYDLAIVYNADEAYVASQLPLLTLQVHNLFRNWGSADSSIPFVNSLEQDTYVIFFLVGVLL